MAIKLSTGLRRAMLTDYGLMAMMNYGHIKLFTGSQPATANAGEQGTLLGYVTKDGSQPVELETGNGLVLALEDYKVVKDGSWTLKAIAGGSIGWWRFCWNGRDTGEYSEFAPRIDGNASDSLLIDDYTVRQGDSIEINGFTLIFPDSRG